MICPVCRHEEGHSKGCRIAEFESLLHECHHLAQYYGQRGHWIRSADGIGPFQWVGSGSDAPMAWPRSVAIRIEEVLEIPETSKFLL